MRRSARLCLSGEQDNIGFGGFARAAPPVRESLIYTRAKAQYPNTPHPHARTKARVKKRFGK